MTGEYNSLRKIALGYATYGTDCYNDPKVLTDILWALDWMNRHYYGKAELEGNGWRNYRLFNWHDWHIGTPEKLMDIMLLVDEHLSIDQKRRYLELFDFLEPAPHDFASNKLMFGKVIICSGILEERNDRILCGRDGVADTFEFSDGGKNYGQGFFRDGSYIFHTHHPQAATYGLEHLRGSIDIATILLGSEFSLSEEKRSVMYYWVENTFFPFYFKGSIMRCVCGRYPELEQLSGYKLLRNCIGLYYLGNGYEKNFIAAFVRQAVDEHPKFVENCCEEFFNLLTLNEYIIFCEILKRDTDVLNVKQEFIVCNNQDRVVARNKDYAISLAMSSSRIYNYESINGKNLYGWYHSDGMLCIYDSPLKYDKVYFEKVNPYRIPGTTVDNRERQAVSIAQRNEYLSNQDFVGGLCVGENGMAAMQLESYHSDGQLICKDYYIATGEYGSAPPKHESSLMAKKSYFFLNDCVVCLGTDINSSDNAPVYTVIENKKQDYIFENGEISGFKQTEIEIDGKSYRPSDEDKKVNAKIIRIDDEEIYLFGEREVTICQKGNEPYFTEILLHHGVNPQNGTYEYAILPCGDNKKPNIELLANSKKYQAIRDLSDGAVYCVFWESGEIAGIKVSEPMLICFKDQKIYACDITQKLKNAGIEIKGKRYSFDFEDKRGKVIVNNENDCISR